MNILFLQRYNNYANRIIKREDIYIETLMQSQAAEGKATFTLENVNFNPNDYITTTFVAGDTQDKQFPDWTPDYCVVYDPNDAMYNEELQETFTPFKSTWFVIETVRLRANQWSLSLKRDVIRDNYDSIKTADIFVEKATLENNNDLIFNSEGQSFNQIKQSETLLKDSTGIQWLVGYCVQDHAEHENLEATYAKPPSASFIQMSALPAKVKAFFDVNAGAAGKNTVVLDNKDNRTDYTIYCKASKQLWTTFVRVTNYASLRFYRGGTWEAIGTGVDANGYKAAMQFTGEQQMAYDINSWNQANWNGVDLVATAINNNRSYIMQQYRLENNITAYDDYLELMNYNGKTIYDGQTGIFWTLRITTTASSASSVTYNFNSNTSNVKARVRQCFVDHAGNGYTFDTTTSNSSPFFNLETKTFTVNVVITQTGTNTVKWTLPALRKQLITEPYDMFCIPFGDFRCSTFNVEREASIAACRAIAQAGIGSSNALVYDIQVLPYCPLQNIIRSNVFNETTLVEHEDFEYVLDPYGNKKSIIFFCSEAEFTFDIPLIINSTDPKVENECDLYRLCSPNYAGLFEFSVAKNRGISFINVDCSYKPFQPYIHLNPDFDGLYGNDFNDSRGLICGGDFSLAICTNAWEQYKLQNKNYQAIFDRGIQKLDDTFDREYNYKMDKALRDLVLPVQGGLTGLASGGPWGALAGAAGSQVNAAWNTNWELKHMSQMHDIEKKYQEDMYNFQMGNIKALPNSLAKTDPFTANNKKWPFLEYYTCTDAEKQAFRDKLKFNGMTVNKIDKIVNYIKPNEKRFFKGELIRDTFIIEDSHMVDAIYSELKKGVYL